MVGRYNELVHGAYKPTNITGGHHPAVIWEIYWVCVYIYREREIGNIIGA